MLFFFRNVCSYGYVDKSFSTLGNAKISRIKDFISDIVSIRYSISFNSYIMIVFHYLVCDFKHSFYILHNNEFGRNFANAFDKVFI